MPARDVFVSPLKAKDILGSSSCSSGVGSGNSISETVNQGKISAANVYEIIGDDENLKETDKPEKINLNGHIEFKNVNINL